MKFNVIVSDPPYSFSDKIAMSERGAEFKYDVMTDEDILQLPVKSIVADDALLALWVPSSKLQLGMDCLKEWGFEQKQTWIWVKTKKSPLDIIYKVMAKKYDEDKSFFLIDSRGFKQQIKDIIGEFDLNNLLNFGMGRLFRNTHEIVLVGTRGQVYDKLENKSQRSVFLGSPGKHSAKPEALQNSLDTMFPSTHANNLNKLEMFARRPRMGWVCVGNECPGSEDEDITDSIKRLMAK